jgi:hypothetical protein
MNRFNFLKKFGIGVAAAVVAPNQFMKEGNVSFIDKDSLKEPAKKTLINLIREDKINMTASCISHATAVISDDPFLSKWDRYDLGNYKKLLSKEYTLTHE